jgi:hypothetical protein
VNWHEVMEERSLAMHRVVAEELRRDPSKLDVVRDWISARLQDEAYSVHSKDAFARWLETINFGGLAGTLSILNDRSEFGRRMRHCSPFAIIMPQDERERIVKEYEARRPRAHPAGV